VSVVLCADDEDRLLPTIRSRVARVRLGTVGIRELEMLLDELGLAQPPEAGRIARTAGGLPGRAVVYARAPEALVRRAEVARTLLDLTSMPRARRLEIARDLLASAAAAGAAIDVARAAITDGPTPSGPTRGRGRRAGGARAPAAPPAGSESRTTGDDAPTEAAGPGAGRVSASERVPAAERRRALAWLLELWSGVTRDLLAVALGDSRAVREPALLDDLVPVAESVPREALTAFLARLAETGGRLEANVSPELALDVLVLAWPRSADAG
jgi:hypothetical protein